MPKPANRLSDPGHSLTDYVTYSTVTQPRPMKAHYILIHNIRALLQARGASAKDLAEFAGHKPAWLSKILAGERGIQFDDLDRIADFFGLTVAQLLQYGVTPLLERRKKERRTGPGDRRQGERRQPNGVKRLYPEMPVFRPKVPRD